jgi:L-seryl-tRNA(Ser) seleniumtransferase
MKDDSPGNPHRLVPSVDAVLQALDAEIDSWGRSQVTRVVRDALAEDRVRISAGETPDLETEALRRRVVERLLADGESRLRPVFNLTGTVLHTNLGRALLPPEAIAAVARVAARPSNLEFDLEQGERGDREAHVEQLVCELTGAGAATVVNNNAAAVLLTLNTLAFNREVPVSRGELVEIGGSFRIPEVMQRANCSLVEVGATNRTHLSDYRAAAGEHTALLMKVHTSNYRVEGFTSAVDESELAALAHELGLPLVVDLGSGSLVDFSALGLPPERTVTRVIADGADLVTFSGDKLLGGPQCGLIAGRPDLVEQVRRNPLKRALRLDKMTLAALEEVLKLYRQPETLTQRLPTLKLLTRPETEIRDQAERLCTPLQILLGETVSVAVQGCRSQIGSGALPVESLPSAALVVTASNGDEATVRQLAARLRRLPVPVIGRLHRGGLWLDLRCLDDEQALLEQLRTTVA